MNLMSTGGLKQWTALPRSFPMTVEGIDGRADRPERVERLLKSRVAEESSRVPVEQEARVPTSMEDFIRQGRQKQAEKYLDTQLVAFRFEGEIEPDPSHAPIASFHPLREVVNAMEEELYAFRPERVFQFLQEAFRRFPGRLPIEDHHAAPLNDDDYGNRIEFAIQKLVSEVALERPDDPFEWLDRWLENESFEESNEFRRRGETLVEKAKTLDVRDLSEREFLEFALDVFKKFDVDKNGELDLWELREVLRSGAFDFSEGELREILTEADRNENGVVEYKEFLPLLHGLMASSRAKTKARALRRRRDSFARDASRPHLVKGMTRDRFDVSLRATLREADEAGEGALDPGAFREALKNSGFGFSKKDITLLVAQCEPNADGRIEYETFVPSCFDLLMERAENAQLELAANPRALAETLLRAFEAEEERSSAIRTSDGGLAAVPKRPGYLQLRQIKRCFLKLAEEDALNLSKTQIVSVLSEANVDPTDGSVEYAPFAEAAAETARGVLDFASQRARLDAINDLAAASADERVRLGAMRNMTKEQVESVLNDAFRACDVDGNGALDEDEMRAVLESVGVSELGLTEKQILGVISAADVDGDGFVDYAELSSLVHDTVTQLSMEDAIRHRAFRNTRASVVGRRDILAPRDDTLGASLASVSTDDVSHLKPDFDAGGRGAAGKIWNSRSVKIRLGGNMEYFT